MSYVEFYDVQDAPIGKAWVAGGKLVVDDSIPGIASTNVIEEGTGKLLSPSSGELFLQNLAAMYEGPYVSAKYFAEDAGNAKAEPEKAEPETLAEMYREARRKDDDEWIPWNHEGGGRGGGHALRPGQKLRKKAAPASAVKTGNNAKLSDSELIKKYEKRKADLESPDALPDAKAKFERTAAEMAKRGLLKGGQPFVSAADRVAKVKSKREQALSQTVAAGKRPPGAPRSVQVRDPDQPGAMPGLRPSYDRYAKPMIGKLEPPKQDPKARAKPGMGDPGLGKGEITDVVTKRKKNSTNPVHTAVIDGVPVHVKPNDTLSTKVLRPFQIPWGYDNERELASQHLNKHLGNLVDTPRVAVRDVPGVGTSLVSETITRGIRGLDEGAPSFSGTVPLPERKNLALYDLIRGESDRHGGNYYLEQKPDGTSHVIPFDHGLSFPQQRSPQNGNWNPLNALTAEERKLDPTHIQMLNDLKTRQDRVEADILPLVGADAVRLMWERVDAMLDTGEFPEVERIRRDEWP